MKEGAVAPLGLTHAQYAMVASLYGMHRTGERPSQRRLADHTGLEALYVSKLARSLGEAKKEFEGGQRDGDTPTKTEPETKAAEAKAEDDKA